MRIRPENKTELREAIGFTSAVTGFSGRLIEKDYYCSLVLEELAPLFSHGLVFKGGTALSKVHADFYRLSEDLDFSISLPCNASRGARRAAIDPAREHLERIRQIPWVSHVDDLQGANRSTQYVGELQYRSCLSEFVESIRLEIGLREPLLEAAHRGHAATLLQNPLTREAGLEPIPVQVMSRREAYAEKIRAAFCRRDVAIRDFYDLDYALASGILTPDESLLQLVHAKNAVPGNDAPDLSPARVELLRRQIEPQLRPVLREQDFLQFQLDRILHTLRSWHIGS